MSKPLQDKVRAPQLPQRTPQRQQQSSNYQQEHSFQQRSQDSSYSQQNDSVLQQDHLIQHDGKSQVLHFYKSLLLQHQESQKISLVALQIINLLNHALNLNPSTSTLLHECFTLLNLLVHPQKLKLPAQQSQEPQQERVRDIIVYLKAIKQVLRIEDNEGLFTISDVIDENNINTQQLVRHLIVVYEKLMGKSIPKVSQLSAQEIQELRRDLEPLTQKPAQQESLMDQQFYQQLKKLEAKCKAYKDEYAKVKLHCKKQEKMLLKYEQALQEVQQRRVSKNKEQDLKNKIFGQFLTHMKSDYESELKHLQQRSRSVSPREPISVRVDTGSQYEETVESKAMQNEVGSTMERLEELELQMKELTREREVLIQEKQDLVYEKHQQSESYSDIKQCYEQLQEEYDTKAQKYKKVKQELDRIQAEGTNNELGVERLKEEVALLQRQKSDADNRTKKFEQQFRSCLKEVEELREQLDQARSQVKGEDEYNGSESSSFYIFNQSSNQNEYKVSELEKEKEYLHLRIQMLEKSNKELVSYKKQLEETLGDIGKEQDPQKRMTMIDINLIRRKSLLRMEQSLLFKENKVVSPEKTESNYQHSNSFLGQRQSVLEQYTPGSKLSMLAAPLEAQQVSTPPPEEESVPQDLNNILDQFVSVSTPVQRNQMNISIQQHDLQDLNYQTCQTNEVNSQSSHSHVQQISIRHEVVPVQTESVAQKLFGVEADDQLQQQEVEDDEVSEGQENILMMMLKKQKTEAAQVDDIKKQVIREEDEYDDEESSSDDDYD